MPLLPPLPYGLVLATIVSLGLPGGPLVMAAGALFGPALGLLVVVAGQGVGLLLNWWLCRGVLRPRVTRWIERTRRGRSLERLLHQPASLRLMVLLRLTLIPMNLVNIACALGPTPLHRLSFLGGRGTSPRSPSPAASPPASASPAGCR